MDELVLTLIDNNVDDCTNSGPACYSCPCFDSCDHHYDVEEQL